VPERAGGQAAVCRVGVLRTLWLLLLVCCGGVAQAAPAAAARAPAGMVAVHAVEGITEYRLPNGLQVLLIPDDSKPTTTVNLTYRVGSRHENYGETGMAHLLEHLLFKGSPRFPQPKADFTARGLSYNGTTWFDRTNYFASFSANDDNLKWYVDWLADSMVNSFIARKDLDTEMTVVRNEMEMGENRPDRILFQKTLAAMYEWHNYGHSTIGARTDVENVDIPRLRAFYKQYYQPDNATLIVAGKFQPAQVLKWVGAAFGKLAKPTRALPRHYTLDAVQDGERSVTLRRVGGVPLLFAAYHTPPGAHPDTAAIELLSLVLGDSPSGRLHKRLTEKQLAAGAFAFSEGLAEPSFIVLGAQLAPGQEVESARTEMLATIESLAREPVTAEELERARAKWLKDWEQAFTSPETVGIALSESVAQGDWRLYFLARDRVRDLKLAEVQRVAGERFVPSNRTLGVYLPTETPVRAPAPARVDAAAMLKDFKPAAAGADVEVFDATPANLDARTQRFDIGGLKAAVLRKGTRGGAVHATLTLRYGDAASLAGSGEVADAVAALLDKGTPTRTRQQVQDELDRLKTEFGFHNAPGRLSVSISSRREHFADAVALLADLLRNPAFPTEALDELQRQSLSGIEQQRKEPEAVAEIALARHGDPYPRGDVRHARNFDEMVEDVTALSVDKLRAFHQRFYGAGHAEFGAAGDIDIASLRQALERGFGGWAAAVPFARVPEPLVEVTPTTLMLPTPDKQNATMLVRQSIALTDADDDYPALSMANYLLGGGGSSRLWKRIRETEGLSYDVRSGMSWSSLDRNSEWQASAIFAPQNRAKVEAAFREEVARALRDGFSAKELAEGQRGLLNFRRLSRAQDATIAGALANNLYLGRSFAVSARVDAAIGRLTREQVHAALRRHLRPDSFVLAFAGDFPPR
jgi:zinc protease